MALLTANQLVAYNLMRARKSAGLSQEQAAGRLAVYRGVRWSKSVYSAAERSYQGKRVRQFTADDVLAMALAFGLPVTYFYLPPPTSERVDDDDGVTGGGRAVSWATLMAVMFSGDGQTCLLPRIRELVRESPSARIERLLAEAGLSGDGITRPPSDAWGYANEKLREILRKEIPYDQPPGVCYFPMGAS